MCLWHPRWGCLQRSINQVPAPVVKWGWAAGAWVLFPAMLPSALEQTDVESATDLPWLHLGLLSQNICLSGKTCLDSLIESTVWKISHSHLFSHSHSNYFLWIKWTSPVHSLRHQWTPQLQNMSCLSLLKVVFPVRTAHFEGSQFGGMLALPML